MAIYHIWLLDMATREVVSHSTRQRYDAAKHEALRVLNRQATESGWNDSRAHHVAANAIRNFIGDKEIVALIDTRHEIHLFRG